MSADKAHGPTAPPDDNNISGEEAWARRLSLSAIAPCITSTVETEPSSPHYTSARQLPCTVPEVDEVESSETQHHRQSSGTSAFLDSTPQWEPPPELRTSQGPSKCLNRKVTNQQARPPLAQEQRPTQQCESGPQIVPPGGPAQVSTHLGLDEKIPGIWKQDSLDGRIGIRPRNKTSNELQQIKDPRYSSGETGFGLPRSMELIIQKFMVANSYIFPYQHLPEDSQPNYRYSLLTRLDLHNTFIATKETRDEQRLIKAAWRSIDGYVFVKSDEWRAQGIFTQSSETEPPTFAAFTNSWTSRDWDGSTGNFSHATELMTSPPVLPMSVDDPDRGSRPTDPEPIKETAREIIVLDIDTGRSDKPCAKLKPARKRHPHDDLSTQVSKRARTRNGSRVMNNHDNVDQTYDRRYDSDFAIPEEKGLVKAIEAIHHARATMSELVPTSASDLAIMQQDWTSHGSPSLLTDLMATGEKYTKKMNKYFAHALHLLSMLRKSSHWKVDGSKVQVDCACQKVHIETGLEELQKSLILKQSTTPCNEGVEVQHSHDDRRDATADPGQDGNYSNEPIPFIGGIRMDRSSEAGAGAASYTYPQGGSFDLPVSMEESSLPDRLYGAIHDQREAPTSDRSQDGSYSNEPIPFIGSTLVDRSSGPEEGAASYTHPQGRLFDPPVSKTVSSQAAHLYSAIPGESDPLLYQDYPPVSTTESPQAAHLYRAIPPESGQMQKWNYPPTSTTEISQAAHLYGAIPKESTQMPNRDYSPVSATEISQAAHLYPETPRQSDQMPNWNSTEAMTERAQIDRLYGAMPMELDQIPDRDYPPTSTSERAQVDHLYGAIPRQSDQMSNSNYPQISTIESTQVDHPYGATPRVSDQMPIWDHPPISTTDRGQNYLSSLLTNSFDNKPGVKPGEDERDSESSKVLLLPSGAPS